ncbi:MAG: tetratricopeptide repeat protein [Gammaproteobacteria bacterium]|nr:tetratricopeptide repeat protein [Gammaproteobacteria bacterium]
MTAAPPMLRLLQQGQVNFTQGAYDAAAACYREALTLDPKSAAAHYNLGLTLYRLDRLDEAVNCFDRAIALQPDTAEAQMMKGLGLYRMGRLEDAAASTRRAIELNPAAAEPYNNLAVICTGQGRYDEAAASARRALALKPDHPEALGSLATACLYLGRPEEAADHCRKALALKPGSVAAHVTLGLACYKLGRWDEARAVFQQAIALQPDSAEAYANLGMIAMHQGALDEALDCCRRAIALKPRHAAAHYNLGLVCFRQGRPAEAARSFDASIAIDPDAAATHSARLYSTLYVEGVPAAESLAAHRAFAARFEAPLRPHWRAHANPRDPERRLRIGYVSPDFRRHSIADFFEPVMGAHDRAGFEICCYYNNSERDAVTGRLQGAADRWLDCADLTDDELAGRIRADGIDILVDLAGHTRNGRLPAFAHRPAPVQVTYLGYPATTGLDAMDYRLCTLATDPPGQEAFHSEALYRLPRTLWCYRPPAGRAPAAGTPALRNGQVTFGSMNLYPKISPAAFAAWMDILRAVPGSRLVMTSVPQGSVRAALAERVAAHGIEAGRVVAHDKLPEPDFHRLLSGIDIALDPFPYTGTTTTCETLWTGIPVVTLIGQTSVARSGYALLKTVGLEELAAADTEDYVRLAVELAHDPERLARLRRELPARFDASPLRDEAAFTRDLEAAYRDMWRRWCASAGEHVPETRRTDPAPSSSPDARQRAEHALQQGHDSYLQGRLDDAAGFFRATLALQPDHAEARRKLGNVCFAQNRMDEAVDCYRLALAVDPALMAAHFNLGRAYARQGLLEEAAASYRAALALQPDLAEAHQALGIALHTLGRVRESAESYRKAITLRPDYAEAYSNLAQACHDMGQMDEALQCCEKTVALKPEFAPAYYNLALVQFRMRRLDEAIASYQTAIRLKPDFAEAYSNLGHACIELDRLDEALQCCQKSIAIEPGFAPARNNLGLAFFRMRRVDEAISQFKSAITLDPGYVEACYNLGVALTNAGLQEEAMQWFTKALALNPDSPEAHGTRLFSMHYLATITARESCAAHREFAARCEAPLRPHWRPHTNTREPARRLRIGYVSADFLGHPVAYFIEPAIARHDRSQLEVFCYFNSVRHDAWTERLQAAADHWLDCANLTDDQLAGRISKDGIDILVDLAGHTRSGRLLTFARKPAPVQVTYLGYPATTGLDAMDYRLCTLDTDPPGQEAFHSEALYRLPRTLWCYRPLAGRTPGMSSHTARNGHVTFGSFNNFAKVSPECIACWAAILSAVPGARLVMTSVPEGSARTRLAQRFAAQGIEAARLHLHDKLPVQDYWQLLRGIDIALDPFPYTGTTTTCETLWTGIPVVTLIGQTSVARSGYALLKTVGLEELAAADTEGYVRLAVELAHDPDRLARLRRELPARFDASPLRDEAAFTRDLEAAYRDMWQRWCAAGAGA